MQPFAVTPQNCYYFSAFSQMRYLSFGFQSYNAKQIGTFTGLFSFSDDSPEKTAMSHSQGISMMSQIAQVWIDTKDNQKYDISI